MGTHISLPLRWTAGSEKTKSYTIFMEDPDAPAAPLPVVHWLLWNIPAGSLRLDEQKPAQDGYEMPDGIREGLNVRGHAGWHTGPKPPKGNPPHHYNIQVFALDRQLALASRSTRLQLLDACDGHCPGRRHL